MPCFNPSDESTWDADWMNHMADVYLCKSQYHRSAGGKSGYMLYFVRFRDDVHEVTASSCVDAINRVRFRLFGRTPESKLDPFDAVSAETFFLQESNRLRAKALEMGMMGDF